MIKLKFIPLTIIFLLMSFVGFSQLDSNDVSVSYGNVVPFPMDEQTVMKEVLVQVEIEDETLISMVTIEVQSQNDLSHKLAIVRMKPEEFNSGNFVDGILTINIGAVDVSQVYLIKSFTTSFQGVQSNVVEKTL